MVAAPAPSFSPLRSVLWAAAGILLLCGALTSAVWGVFENRRPDLAVRWLGGSAQAKAQLALKLIPTGSGAWTLAQQRAGEAFARDPLNVTSLVALGTLASIQKDDDAARSIFRHSERLSRRNLPTQLWLIEDAVSGGDIRLALVHYDRAMRTSLRSRELLIPVLAAASSHPEVASQVVPYLRARASWWAEYLNRLIFTAPVPATMPAIVAAANLRTDGSEERPLLAAAVAHLVNLGRIDAAFGLYRPRGAQQLRNGGFERENILPPLDWKVRDTELDYGAAVRPAPSGGQALFIMAGTDMGGPVAEQILRLAPGRYRLSTRAGDISKRESERPVIKVACLGGVGLIDRSVPAATRATFMIEVPQQGCAAQRLVVESRPRPDTGSPEAWLDDVSVLPS